MKQLIFLYLLITGTLSCTHIDNKPSSSHESNITSIDNLISKLDTTLVLEETGKAYWIGYNDQMDTIASFGSEAIESLERFINNDNTSIDGRVAGIYTIHLIGINRQVKGRFNEEFVNKEARHSLLNYVRSKNETIRDLVVKLLMRDPWKSDVSVLISVMEDSEDDCWTLVNSLMRYQLKNIPFHNSLPTELRKINIDYTTAEDICSEEFFWDILKAIEIGLKERVIIEKTLFETNLWGYSCSGYNRHEFQDLLNDIVENDQVFSYCDLGNKVQYYIENDRIYLCSSMTAKNRWIDWWERQSEEYKSEFKLLPTKNKRQ